PIEDTGKADHARKARVILRRRLMNNFPGLVYADQVRHYRMGDEDRNADEDHVLKRLLLDFVKVPGRLCQSPLRTHVTFNPVLDLAEHHFHKDRLRTGPSTPYPPEDYCKEDDEDEEGNEGNREEDEILGPEGLAEDDETSFEHIQQYHRLAPDLDKRCAEEEEEKQGRDNSPGVVKLSRRFLRVDPNPLTGLVDGRQF